MSRVSFEDFESWLSPNNKTGKKNVFLLLSINLTKILATLGPPKVTFFYHSTKNPYFFPYLALLSKKAFKKIFLITI